MKYVVGFTEAPAQHPFHWYESDVATPDFVVGSRVLFPGHSPKWLQILSVAYQILPEAVVTTVLVAPGTTVGGEGDDFVPWPW